MISYLRGQILKKGAGFIILEANNIGYKVFIAAPMYADVSTGDEIELYIHHHIKEDAQNLYGFREFNELEFFELLISISGIGPKSALGILAMSSVEEIKSSIAQGDPSMLNKVSGIGNKTAERIVLELRNKIDGLAAVKNKGADGFSAASDEIDALVSLGYTPQQARDALKKVEQSITDSSERIRAALKNVQ